MSSQPSPLRILGIDPGTGTTGFGVIDVLPSGPVHVAHGVIRTSPGDPLERRLQTLADDLGALLAKYLPTEVAVEELYFDTNVTTAIAVAQARGVILLEVARAGLVVASYGAPEVKSTVAGAGGAKKGAIQIMVQRLLALAKRPTPDDAADALAVAITHRVRRRSNALRRSLPPRTR